MRTRETGIEVQLPSSCRPIIIELEWNMLLAYFLIEHGQMLESSSLSKQCTTNFCMRIVGSVLKHDQYDSYTEQDILYRPQVCHNIGSPISTTHCNLVITQRAHRCLVCRGADQKPQGIDVLMSTKSYSESLIETPAQQASMSAEQASSSARSKNLSQGNAKNIMTCTVVCNELWS